MHAKHRTKLGKVEKIRNVLFFLYHIGTKMIKAVAKVFWENII